MLGASFLPARWRTDDDNTAHRKPTWLSRQINPSLGNLSSRATTHPIYTIVCVAILASTTYLGLLESSLFDGQTSVSQAGGNVDFDSLVAGSKRLYTNAESNWRWTIEENGFDRKIDDVRDYSGIIHGYELINAVERRADNFRFPQFGLEYTRDCPPARFCPNTLQFDC